MKARILSDFNVIQTADGSPSLSIADASGYVEKMHHSAGAMSESLYIYGAAIQTVLERGWRPRTLSLGLGLGYNEIITAGFTAKFDVPLEALFSFETEPVLSESFLTWVQGRPSHFVEMYEDILNRAQESLGVPAAQIKQQLLQASESQAWSLRGSFPEDAGGISSVNCVLYDAFSNKMNASLWNEEFLVKTLDEFADSNCVFATYAVTGALKRALRRLGFVLQEKPGFAGKRESTFAIRERCS